jgi:2,4-dienoyl-CoA reductase-like NADH-dependent reductase (Old Yellow Enzyme family)
LLTAFQPDGGQPLSSTIKPIHSGNLTAADGSLQPYSTPRALNIEEIYALIGDFVMAAKNAISAGEKPSQREHRTLRIPQNVE